MTYMISEGRNKPDTKQIQPSNIIGAVLSNVRHKGFAIKTREVTLGRLAQLVCGMKDEYNYLLIQSCMYSNSR